MSESAEILITLEKTKELEDAAESRQTGIVVNRHMLPGAATVEDLCKAMQEKHPDMKFSVLHKPEQQISFLMFDPKE